jgi:tetratricopeptide (TPR) repeat protein
LAIGTVGGIAFGVPSIRNAIMGTTPAPAGDSGAVVDSGAAGVAKGDEGAGVAEKPSLLADADAALAHLGVEAVSKAEVAIQQAVDSGGIEQAEYARMRLKQADLLSSRGLAYEMAAAATQDAKAKAELHEKAKDDLERALRIVDGFGADAPQGEEMQSVRAQVRLLDGTDADAVEGILPKEGAEQAHLLVDGAAVWRDEKPRVKRKLVRDLEDLEELTGLERSLLALALLHSDDPDGARELAKHIEAQAEDSPVAVAVLAALGREDGDSGAKEADSGDGEAADDGGQADTADDGGAADDPPVVAVTKKKKATGGGGGGGGSSLDRMISKGCGQVHSGKYSAGVKTMLAAFDRAPGDLDVMVCLAEGYDGMGQASSAATFYDRVLKKSPNHRVALKKAAALAAKRGSTKKALKLYKRLLKVEPGNAAAKAYVDQHGTPAPAPAPAGGTTPAAPSGDAPKPAPPAGTGTTPPSGGPSGGATPPTGSGG